MNNKWFICIAEPSNERGIIMASVLEVIKKRRSVRRYKAQQITDEELNFIVEAGRLAPSGHNSQTAHFIVVQKPEVLDALREVVRAEFAKMELPDDPHHPMSAPIRLSQKGTYNFMYNPPTFIIAANKRGYGNAMADCSLAIGNMMLMATELGVGTCWINQIKSLGENENIIACLRKYGLAEDEIVCGCLAVGYSDQPELPPVIIKGNKVDFVR